jgi:hypothetical protein
VAVAPHSSKATSLRCWLKFHRIWPGDNPRVTFAEKSGEPLLELWRHAADEASDFGSNAEATAPDTADQPGLVADEIPGQTEQARTAQNRPDLECGGEWDSVSGLVTASLGSDPGSDDLCVPKLALRSSWPPSSIVAL